MKTVTRPKPPFRKRVSNRLFRTRKKLYHLSRVGDSDNKTLLFIIGCQRSGTNLVLRIFDRDLNTKVYGEFSKLSSEASDKLRLNPLDSVKQELDKDNMPLIVIKPLVETQNATKLLNYFEGSKAFWLYRHYQDVASSNLKRFGMGNGIKNLRPIVENDPYNWRSEHVPEDVRKIVLDHFSDDMNPYDAAALFWFVRNNFFFELGLDNNPNIIMCKYDELVTNPYHTMQRIYEFVGQPFPGDKVLKEVHTGSVGKGKNIELSPEIEYLCKQLLDKLDEAYLKETVIN